MSGGAQPGEPEFIILIKNPDDRVSVQYENGMALIDVHSPAGIGSASLEVASGVMPQSILVRLHIQGLEEFRIKSAAESVSASVSSSDAARIDERILSPDGEAPLRPGHPLWMKIQIVSDQKSIPLEEGYFEIALPADFLRQAGSTFEIEWIDFYR